MKRRLRIRTIKKAKEGGGKITYKQPGNELTKHTEHERIFSLKTDKIGKEKTYDADTGIRKRLRVVYPEAGYRKGKIITKEFDEHGDIIKYKKEVYGGRTIEKEFKAGELKKKITTKKGKKKTIEYT